MARVFGIIIGILFLIVGNGANAQNNSEYLIRYVIEGNDTVLIETLPEAVILPYRKFNSKRQYRQYYRMVYNLKKVYPYSQIAKRKISEINRQYLELPRKERKAYLKAFEKELFAEFEAPLKKLSRSQGKMLIKLIDREIGETSYKIVKELKGGFNAFLWQSMARLFGSNLKSKYDKYGDDEVLEELVLMCELGTFDDLYHSLFVYK